MTLPFDLSSTLDTSIVSGQGMEEIDAINSNGADHLCVLVHGLWGNPKHLNYLATSLREKYPEDRLHILVAKRNSGSFTYDGIELGGERVTAEIEETLEELARNGNKVRKLSVIGYSLGGLVARYAIGLLYHKGWFDKLEPINFTTFATPHLGVRTPLLGFHNHIWNVLGARTLSTSGRQLFTIDTFRDTGRPLLSVLADPSSIFIRALASFKHRSLYSNIINDRSAVFYTTAISRVDPFNDLNAIQINYLKGYAPIILDPDHPVSAKDADAHLPALHQRLALSSRLALTRIPLMAFLLVFIPIGSVLFLINSGVQSVRSRQRIRLHEQGRLGIGAGVYRIPLMVREARRTAEDVYENVNNAQSQEYLPEGSELETGSSGRSGRSFSSSSEKPEPSALSSSDESGVEVDEPRTPRMQRRAMPEFPTLALTPDQFAMIQALDDVGWRKYPVHIHNVGHSHAAIIVRMARKSFEEGKTVVGHWLSEFEV